MPNLFWSRQLSSDVTRSCKGEWKLKVTHLRILPGTGKIELTAGSPEWSTRGM